jgi:hypothetical protein
MTAQRSLIHCTKASWVLVLAGAMGCAPEPDERQPAAEEKVDLCAAAPACDDSVAIASDSPALLVNDPAALVGLRLEAVLWQLLALQGDLRTTPTELLQRLFDTENTDQAGVFADGFHCDTEGNPAHQRWPAAFCPRAEGALAKSHGFFTPGDPDHFFPVAVVNRLDLMPAGAGTCGEYRIVYAKESGLTDPGNRLFLIFEASLPNPEPGCALACRPVAELWRSLEAAPAERAARLTKFFFEGLPGFDPPIHPSHFGSVPIAGDGYYGVGGQVRVSERMEEHWQMRELHLVMDPHGRTRFEPAMVGNNPFPSAFEPLPAGQSSYRTGSFLRSFADESVPTLASRQLLQIGMTTPARCLGGESALGGPALNDYATRAASNADLQTAIQKALIEPGLGAHCPVGDPLTADSILRRAMVQSCAGCHAPAQFLGPERQLGCGLSWPESLGETHIDEHGALSPALKEVFLPHRAEVLASYLRACGAETTAGDATAPPASEAQAQSPAPRRTLGGSVTH